MKKVMGWLTGHCPSCGIANWFPVDEIKHSEYTYIKCNECEKVRKAFVINLGRYYCLAPDKNADVSILGARTSKDQFSPTPVSPQNKKKAGFAWIDTDRGRIIFRIEPSEGRVYLQQFLTGAMPRGKERPSLEPGESFDVSSFKCLARSVDMLWDLPRQLKVDGWSQVSDAKGYDVGQVLGDAGEYVVQAVNRDTDQILLTANNR